MHPLHRFAKRRLHRAYSTPFTNLAELPLHSFLHRCLLEEGPAHKNTIDKFARHFSIFSEDPIHETNQQEGCDVYQDASLSQRMHMVISEGSKCKVDHGAFDLAEGLTTLSSGTHMDDCVHAHVDDSVSTRFLASQKDSELEAGTIPHQNNEQTQQSDNVSTAVAKADFLLKQKEGNKHLVGSTSGLATFNACKVICEYIRQEKHFDNSMQKGGSDRVQTMKHLSRAKQQYIGNDCTSEFSVCDIESMLGNHTGELVENERSKQSANYTETGLQREDVGMFRFKDDAKTPCDENAQERTCDDVYGFLNNASSSKKVDSFTMEQGQASQPHERVYCVAQKKINKKKMKKKMMMKKKNTNGQIEPEELEHLSLTSHPFWVAAAQQVSCKEKLQKHIEISKDDHTWLPNQDLVKSKIISPDVCEKSPAVSSDALKLNDRKKRESVDAVFADMIQVNQVISNGFVEKNQKLFSCENSVKSRLDQGQKSGEVSKHMKSVAQSNEKEGKPFENESQEVELIDKNDASSSIHLVEKWQSVHSTLKPHTCKENEVDNATCGSFCTNGRKTITYDQIKGGTSLDPPSDFWKGVKTIAPVETIECSAERVEWDLDGLRKVQHSLRNFRELYIILDLNGVLIKRWDKNPSLPGVLKLNKRWIQLRPGCVEFLQKAFSSFRVGIWSTMTQKNLLNMWKFLEQQANQSLPFFMLWSKDSCYQHRGVHRPNMAYVAADFKPLSRVWVYFKPFLGFHNTVLVDDSPYKACMNNPHNCIFPDAFEGYTDDNFLNDVLWPYLESMRMSHNIQAYIANNPLGQPPIVAGHELYNHVHKVMNAFHFTVQAH